MNTHQKVLAEVDKLKERLVAATSQCIQIESINPKYPGQVYEDLVGGEGRASRFMAELYREAGANIDFVTAEPGRDNAVGVVPGAGNGRSLILNGHVDVVPPNREELWERPPFSGAVDEGRIYGRGATDCKGGVVAAAFAAIALKNAGVNLKGDLILQSVVGEEVGDHEAGTSAVLAAGYKGDAAIVVEPTSFDETAPNAVPVTPGLLWFSVEIEGRAAHSGLRGLTVHPTLEGESLGVNTIDKFWVIYNALRALENEWALRDRHELFPPGYFNILPGVLSAHPHGVEIPFFLADHLRVEYCVYHHPSRTNEEVMSEIRRAVAHACEGDSWLRDHPAVVTEKLLWAPYEAPEDHPIHECVARSFSAVTGRGITREGFLGVCDLTWAKNAGIEGIAFGPGVGRTAHAIDEYVMIDQLVTACKTYALAAVEFCGAV